MNTNNRMRKVKLKKISSIHTDEERSKRHVGEKIYTGKMMIGPSVGKSFCFYRDDGEYMHTSTIKNIEFRSAKELVLTTLNSVYSLEIGDSFDE